MEGFRYIDIFSTKGIEYLIVIGFLAGFLVYSRYLRARRAAAPAGVPAADSVEWFRVPEALHFHQGHSWLRQDGGELATVGWDDFARKMVGKVDAVSLPRVGATLRQGEMGWAVVADGVRIPMVSPVDGVVEAVNRKAASDPGVMLRDPYGEGWLVKVRSPRVRTNARNLLSGRLACQWMENSLAALRAGSGGSLGTVYQDGGLPVDGIARALYGDDWGLEVRNFFLTGDDS